MNELRGRSLEIGGLSAEFEGSDLGHGKRRQRLLRMVAQAAPNPAASFPDMAGEGINRLYEFLANEAVTSEDILEGHRQQTLKRCKAAGMVYVVTDTTEFCFGRVYREGLGPVIGGYGFLAHVALAVAKSGRVLGVLGFAPWVRPLPDDPEGVARKQMSKRERSVDPNRESVRWKRMVDEVEDLLKDTGILATYLCDREGDDYPLLESFVSQRRRCVVRIMHDRPLVSVDGGATQKLYETMDGLKGVVVRDVPISARRAETSKKKTRAPKAVATHPPRQSRTATLHFSATTVTVHRPHASHADLPKTLTFNVVHVFEPNPPDGEPPVEWRLMTTLPVNTPEQIAAVVDAYCARWTIEEYFKALKTGCQIEKRQLELGDRLIKATAFFLPMAYHLLLLRDVARESPEDDASSVLLAPALDVLKAMARRPLPAAPTVRDAYLAVAALGGHLKRNGEPGWITLARGMTKLMGYAAGWDACAQQGTR